MRTAITFAFCVFLALPVHAGCIGSGNFYTCNDNQGNNYAINKLGSMTTVNGSNYRTGTRWNQTSNTFGNMTTTNGRASNGNRWNSTETNFGNGFRTINGSDSQGNRFNVNCTQFGCH